ncbi:hypothetical protein [Bradyrhizobium diazoefficiens]|uniref:hypothetical protein n=1 Tax=Bradyrhizobium diazoefficiens TaxID=1355477 RepID=UPI00289E7FAE|nr:hypothetical protein [Bradyrhizobium diazoefficiens]
MLHRGVAFEPPRDLVSHPGLSICREAGILASWASDATAIASCPPLIAPEGLKAPAAIDEILEALCALDGGPRQLHAGVAITGPRSAALFYDLSKLTSDPRQQDPASDIYRHRAG